MAKTVCPVCGHDDQIQNVLAIRRQGTASGVYSGPTAGLTISGGKLGVMGGATALSGTSMTELARVLTPRGKPKERKASSTAGALILVVATWIFIGGICLSSQSYPTSTQSSGSFLLVFGVLLGVLGGVIAYSQIHGKKELCEKENAEELAKWQAEMTIYERLYYCFRDDITFDSITGEYRPLMQTWQLLQQQNVS